MMGSYCHCQQVVTFFFFFGLHLTTWVKGPTLTLCPGPLNFSGRPWGPVRTTYNGDGEDVM